MGWNPFRKNSEPAVDAAPAGTADPPAASVSAPAARASAPVVTLAALPEDLPHKPTDDEIDVYGLTHAGKVRKVNQDHFILATLHRELSVMRTSLPSLEGLPVGRERVAFLAVVADGVGGGTKGGEASQLAIREATQLVSETTRCYFEGGADALGPALTEAAYRTHASVQERAAADPELKGMATTLTLWLGVWPWIYILQVGDSRHYLFRDGKLTQLTQDQTMAQALVEQGVMTSEQASQSRWSNVLASSIGGQQTAPVVTRFPSDTGTIHLMCSDGLPKHVSDEKIRERLATMTSAKQVCEQLVQDALDGGGSDNVTVLVGRIVLKEPR